MPELYQRLTLLETDTPTFSISLRLLAAGIVSCTLMYIFGGTWQDFIATFFVGVIGYASYLFTQKLFQVPYSIHSQPLLSLVCWPIWLCFFA